MNASSLTNPSFRPQETLPSSSDAALRGASIAFANPRSSPTSTPTSPSAIVGGALTAAHRAGLGSRPSSPGNPKTYSISPGPRNSSPLAIPERQGQRRSPSPSNVAAVLAASKWSASQKHKDKEKAALIARKLDSAHTEEARISGKMDGKLPNDETSIPPTSSLIKLFEGDDKTRTTVVKSSANPPPVLSPKPQRALSLSLRLQQQDGAVEDVASKKPPPPKKPGKLVKQNSELSSQQPTPDSAPARRGAKEEASTLPPGPSNPTKSRPDVPAPRRSAKVPAKSQEQIPKTHPSGTPNPVAASLANQPLRPTSTPGVRIPPGKHLSPHMTGDSLANAIVASTLAASSTPSPATSPRPPPLLPSRGTDLQQARRLKGFASRTPSPSKGRPGGLRQTMRADPASSSSSGDDRHRNNAMKKVFGRKHPNKHREGSRKRWRDEVTERERKRYEGLWAANKGACIAHPRHQEDVHGFVVRDIWARSRLPMDVLHDVWELVDTRGEGRLKREEFVVGMWLIDQRLKGRKLPFKVGDSVWSSVRGLGFIVRRP